MYAAAIAISVRWRTVSLRLQGHTCIGFRFRIQRSVVLRESVIIVIGVLNRTCLSLRSGRGGNVMGKLQR